MALNNQEKFFKEFILFAKDKDTTPEELEKHLSQVISAYVSENLKGTKLEGSTVTVKKENFVEATKDGNTPIENPKETQANALRIGEDFIWKTRLENIVDDLLYNEEEGRAADNAYEFFSDLNAKVIQFKKEYNSKNFEITRGDNDIMLGLQYAKYAILDTSKKIEKDSNKEAIIKTATQLIRVAKSSDLDIDVSDNIGKRAIEDLVFFADENDIATVDIQSVDEIILNNPKLIEEYDILRVEYNVDGTRKTYNEIIADRDEKRAQIEENGSITLASTRNSLLRQLDKGYAQVLYNEIINQYKSNEIESIIDEHGEQAVLDEINKIIKYREDDIRDVELRKTNIENYMERNDKVLTAELTSSTLSEFKQVVGDVDIEGEFIEESVKSDEALQVSNMDILNNVRQDLEDRIKEKEEQKEIQIKEEQEKELDEKPDDKKEKKNTERHNTNIFVNINRSKTDNSTNNTTNNTTTVQQDEKDNKKNVDREDEPVIVTEPKYVEEPAGKDGKDGEEGKQGPAGEDGKDGENGLNGSDGKDGTNGNNGTNGKDDKKDNSKYIEEPQSESDNEYSPNDDINDLKNKIDELTNKPNLDTSILIGIEQLKSLYKQLLEKNNDEEIINLKKMIEDLQNKIEENSKEKGVETQEEPTDTENKTIDVEEPEKEIEEPVLVEPTNSENDASAIEDKSQDETSKDVEKTSVPNNTNVTININANITPEEKNNNVKESNENIDEKKITELMNQLVTIHDQSRKMAIQALDNERVRKIQEAEDRVTTMYQQGLLNLEAANRLLDAKVNIIDAEMGVGMEELDRKMASTYEKIRVIAKEGVVGKQTLGIELEEERKKNVQNKEELEEVTKKRDSIIEDGTSLELIKIETEKEKEDKAKEELKNGKDIS